MACRRAPCGGVVHQDIHGPQTVADLLEEEEGELVGVAQIRLDDERGAPELPDPLAGLGELAVRTSDEDDARARAGELERHRPADAPAGAGNQCGPAFE